MISLSDKIFTILPALELNELSTQRRMLHLPGAFPQCSEIMSWGWVEDFLNRERGNPRLFRFAMNGKLIDPIRFALIDGKGRLNLSVLRPMLDQGLTAIFNHLEESSDYFWEETIRFEQALGVVASIDAIGSFGTTFGLGPHYDARDLIIMQIAGRKRWSMLGEPIDGPWRYRTVPESDTVTKEFVMQPGDLLFVPAGLRHRCFPLEPSLHLGVLIRRPCAADLLEAMQKGWETETVLGRRLSLDEGEAGLRQQEAMVKEALVRLVQDADITALARAWVRKQQRPPRVGLLKGGDEREDGRP